MLIHDTCKSILGFMRHERMNWISNGGLHHDKVQKVMRRYPLRKADPYTFSTLDHSWMKRICELNRLSQVDGFTPLNVPCHLMSEYDFTSGNPMDIDFGFSPFQTNKNTFMHHIAPCNHNDHLRHLQNLTELTATLKAKDPKRIIVAIGRGCKSYISKYLAKNPDVFHVLCKIPKGETTLHPSDHWYNLPVKALPNPYDIHVVVACNEASADELSFNTCYKSAMEDVMNDLSKKKRIKQLTVFLTLFDIVF